MRRSFIVFILIAGIVGCQSKSGLIENNLRTEMGQNESLSGKVPGDNNRVSFLADTDFKAWSEICTLEDRFSACNIPERTAKALTTRALVVSAAHYPLNYLFLAYDDPLSAVRLIVKNSQLHQELLTRSDATDELVRFFSETELILGGKKSYSRMDTQLTYTEELFFEYFLLFWVKTKEIEKESCQFLLETIALKYSERASQKEIYSEFSLAPLNSLRTEIEQHSSHNTPLRTSITIYTPMGHALSAEQILQDYSPTESSEITLCYEINYPSAIVLRPASRLYNCHSYAWYSDSTSNNVWLNSHLSEDQSQLMLYWSFDWYKEWYESASEKATYMQSSADDSHSARITSSGAYVSKWGAGPLMQHSKTYCPYSTSEMHYYRAKTFPENEITIMGDNVVLPSTTHIYYLDYFDHEADPYDYDVTVTYLPSPGQSNTYTFTTINKPSQIYGLECYEYGAYKIRVEYERIAGCLTYGEKLVACVGARTMQRIRDENVTDLETFLRDNWDSISE